MRRVFFTMAQPILSNRQRIGGACEIGACERTTLQRLHQGVGECGQEHAKLMSLEALAISARAE